VSDAETRADAAFEGESGGPHRACFAMCIAQGVSTDYMAFVEKRQIASLSVAKRSNSYAQQLMRVDPKILRCLPDRGNLGVHGGQPAVFSSGGSYTSTTWMAIRSAA